MKEREPKMPRYIGPFAKECTEFLTTKHALGYKYKSESRQLVTLDKISFDYENNGSMPKELILEYIKLKNNESPKSRNNRISLMREFAIFLNSLNISAYIPELPKLSTSFVPYIFTDKEIQAFFESVDNIKPQKWPELAHLVYPALFRMLYGCGLRISEALRLKIKDVDLHRGILTVKGAKFGKDRLVVMSESLTKTCADYAEKAHTFSTDDSRFFPSYDGGEYSITSVYCRFRTLLHKSGISHGGRGNGPRLHDFRHTFSVHCLNNWVRTNQNPMVLLPILSAFLGHSRVSATEKYLRLIPQMHYDITQKTEKLFANIFPVVEPSLWEGVEND